MELNISKNSTIGQIKDQFNAYFKNVKIEFYHHKHGKREGSEKNDQVADSVLLQDLVKTPTSIHAEFDKSIKIADLEKIFEQDFGLYIQVFRKYGDAWLQTTLSDHWSLQMAEMAAEELEAVKNEKPSFDSSN